MDLDYIKRTGIAAAYEGARVLRSHLGNLTTISRKSELELVTEADVAAEAAVLSVIRSRFPDHDILAEESGRTVGDADRQWIIDPLDGTTNFAHEIPVFAVSIAFALAGEPTAGVVLNPMSGELFCALKGDGATLNGTPIRVSKAETLSESLLATGFPYTVRENIDEIMHRFSRCTRSARGIRRMGAAALDLCYVACGRFDGFWEQTLQPWDTAAGSLIAAEAGALVTDFFGNPYRVGRGDILATNGKIHNDMMSLLT